MEMSQITGCIDEVLNIDWYKLVEKFLNRIYVYVFGPTCSEFWIV